VTATLTPREWEVVRRLALSQTWEEVCHDLGITRPTLQNHRSNAVARYGVETLTGLFRALGWLKVPGAEEIGAVRMLDAADRLENAIVSARALLNELRTPVSHGGVRNALPVDGGPGLIRANPASSPYTEAPAWRQGA